MNAIAQPRPIGRASLPCEDLIIDLFAGGGGASEAILAASGRHPDIAVNHDAEAISLHTTNHRPTLHLCDDIRKVDIAATLALFGNRRVGLMWASPDCKDHSKAKGGKPKDKNIRGLAWEVLRWAASIRRSTGAVPAMIALENVEEFQDWGPLHRYGERANTVQKGRRGELFKLWVEQLKSIGYKRVEWRELVAADYGAPTTRKRLFLVAVAEDRPIIWKRPTHGRRGKVGAQRDLLHETLEPYRTAASDVINWSLPIPSIFGRKKPLQPKTRARIAKGIKRYVIESPKPFIVPVTHTQGGDSTRPVSDPLRTITTAKGGEFAISAPTIMPLTHRGDGDRSYSPEDPLKTVTAANRGEFGLAAVHMTKFSENSIGTDPRDPLHTAMAGAPRHGLVAAYLGRQFGTTVSGRSVEDPHPAVMTDGGGGKSQIVAAHLGRQFKRSVGSDAADPVGTITAGGSGKTQLVAAHMSSVAYGDDRPRAGDRNKSAVEPIGTVTGANDKTIVASVIDKYYGTGVAADAGEPLDTATTRAKFGLASAFMEQANTGMVGHDAREPVSTIVGAGSTQRLVDAALEAAGSESPRRRDVLQFLWEHFGQPTEEEIADPLASASGRLRFGLVILNDTVWQIVDIGMRMLVPRELYNAQGFPANYEIEITWEGKRLTKTAQTRMAGNSVSPPPAIAVLAENLPAAMRMREAA